MTVGGTRSDDPELGQVYGHARGSLGGDCARIGVVRPSHSHRRAVLKTPVTEVTFTTVQNSFVCVTCASMQGWRPYMEDYCVSLLEMPNDRSACFFAVYDGHGGSAVAQFAASQLHLNLATRPEYVRGDIVRALDQAFLQTDRQLLDYDIIGSEEMVGSTALVVLIKDDTIYCGNSGDSRGMSCVGGEQVPLSFDHKPYDANELFRIIDAGSTVDRYRVDGRLALCRALGDTFFKRGSLEPEDQAVTAHPEVTVHPLTEDHEFLLLSSDGILDTTTSDSLVRFVRLRIAREIPPEEICRSVMRHCLAPQPSSGGLGMDNMSLVLVCFLRGRSYRDLARLCARPTRPASTLYHLL